jgi:UDP-glucose 4-epimerase
VTLLLTGGGGFLGSTIARALAARGDRLIITDAIGPDLPEGIDPGAVDDGRIRTWTLDVRDVAAVEATIRETGADRIVHLAALLTPECAADPWLGTAVNALGTAAVFTAARRLGVSPVVFGSSAAALSPDDGRALSVYGATKAFGELLAVAMAEADGLDLVGLRFGWIYGAGRTRGWNDVQQVIEEFASGVAEVRYPAYEEPMDWTYIDDAVRAVLAALDTPRQPSVMLAVFGDRRPIGDAIAHLVARCPGTRAVPVPATLPAAGWEMTGAAAGASLELGPVTPLEEGLDRTLAALRARRGVPSGHHSQEVQP